MGARRQEKGGIKYIYALGRELGLSDSALGHDDDLHILVEGVTGCSSIKNCRRRSRTPSFMSCSAARLRQRRRRCTGAKSRVITMKYRAA